MLLVASGIVASLGRAEVATATILPGKGIAGVRLYMTQHQVRAVLGPPSGRKKMKHRYVGGGARYRYARRRLVVRFSDGLPGTRLRRVFSITTRDLRERTRFSRVGVGLHERTARRRLRGERCQRKRHPRYCTVKTSAGAVTFFRFKDRRVTAVETLLEPGFA